MDEISLTNKTALPYLCKMNKEEQFKSLHERLSKDLNWPQVYMFKFIVVAENKKIALIQSKFSDEAIINQKESSGGKYLSITVKEVMLCADSVIERYLEISTIEGVIAL